MCPQKIEFQKLCSSHFGILPHLQTLSAIVHIVFLHSCLVKVPHIIKSADIKFASDTDLQ